MAVGDRVVVGDSYTFKENGNSIMVYIPKLDEHGQHVRTPDGGTVTVSAGGVKIGSTGTIQGPPISVHRTYVPSIESSGASLGIRDFVQMVPVFFDRYQNTAYVPVDNIRLFGSHTN